jgi:hypothetical protein
MKDQVAMVSGGSRLGGQTAPGSGRKLAAGVKRLAEAGVAHFVASFETCVGTRQAKRRHGAA